MDAVSFSDRTKKWSTVALMVGAVGLSVAAFLYFFNLQTTMYYVDAQSHLLIARRVLDNNTGGWSFAQLGGVWLPLPHLLALPLVAIDPLYHTGIAGSLVSMVSYVLTVYFLFRLAARVADDHWVGILAGLLFALNPNVLYMQSTAMTELPLYFLVAASVYYLLLASREPQRLSHLFWCGLSAALATWVRYEAWIILAMESLIMTWIFWRAGFDRRRWFDHLLFFSYLAFAGVFGWMVWNAMIFGNALEFQVGEYAKPALWVSASDPVIGNLQLSFMTYLEATLLNVGPLLYVGLFGAVVYVLRQRLRTTSLAPLVLLAIFPAFVVMLYLGQRPLKVPLYMNGDMYNIRFALFMVLFVSVFAGYLARKNLLLKVLLAVAMVLVYLQQFQTGIITLDDPALDQRTVLRLTQGEGSVWFRECYDGGLALIESYGNEKFQFDSQIDLSQYIYEGSYQLWEPALAEPWQAVRWVVMRGPTVEGGGRHVDVFTDKVWNTWRLSPEFAEHFTLWYRNEGLEVWRLTDASYSGPASCQMASDHAVGSE